MPRPGRGAAFGAVAGLGVVLLGVASAPWLHVPVATTLARETLSVRGTTAVPAAAACAVALLAAGLALALSGRVTRVLPLVATAGAGLIAALAALSLVADPTPAALTAAAEATGVRALDGDPRTTAWPVLAAGLGLVAVAAAGVLAWASRGWPDGGGRRYERGADHDDHGERGDHDADHGAHHDERGGRSEGRVPGVGPDGRGPGSTAESNQRVAGEHQAGERVQAMDDWDALSRGEDPT